MAIWVLVADASRARLFRAVKRNGPLEELRDWAHPEARQHEGDLVTDDAGSRKGPAGRHGVASEPVHKAVEEERFAQDLVAELERARVNGDFSRLYIVASPRFLGLLRKQASKELLEKVSGEVDKDLTLQGPEDIRNQLPQYL